MCASVFLPPWVWGEGEAVLGQVRATGEEWAGGISADGLVSHLSCSCLLAPSGPAPSMQALPIPGPG